MAEESGVIPVKATSKRFDDLLARTDGRAFLPGGEGYADHVGGFNLAVTQRPDVVVAAESPAQVTAAVGYATSVGAGLALQCSGHGAGPAMSEGVLVNTGGMRQVSVDPERRIATVAAGARWSDVFAAATPHGLGGLCGSTSDVGVVGYTLGGGLPVLGRAYGYACDQVLSMDVVTADGRRLSVSDEVEPELFWALCGGAGGLGVVTSMTFALRDLQQIYGGGIFYDGEDAEAVLREYAAWTSTVPDDLCSSLAFLRLPPIPEIPEPLRGRFSMHVRVAYPGSADAGERLVEPMRSCAPVTMDTLGVMPYAALDSIHMDPREPVPFREAGALVDGLTPALQQLLIGQAGPQANCPFLIVEVRHLGGALRGDNGSAVGHSDAGFHLLAVEVQHGPDARLTDASERFRTALNGHTTGYFANLRGESADPQVVRSCWSGEKYARLQRVKRAYDPEGVFCFDRGVSLERPIAAEPEPLV